MSTSSRIATCLMLWTCAAAAQDWDRRVEADGRGLPAGSGTAAEGAAVYEQHCRSCHGPGGRGASAQELVGGVGGLAGPYPDKTIGSYWPYAPPLFDYIRRAMPPQAPLSLNAADTYAVVAYLLAKNDLVEDSTRVDAAVLAGLRMPNRDGFRPGPRVPR